KKKFRQYIFILLLTSVVFSVDRDHEKEVGQKSIFSCVVVFGCCCYVRRQLATVAGLLTTVSEIHAAESVECLNRALNRLKDIWEEIGIPEDQRLQRTDVVRKHIKVSSASFQTHICLLFIQWALEGGYNLWNVPT
uniref:Uncharacterized protein n=1 Tax=Hucho hucho TaxID=62062 RepID=A0A4W5LFP3_9TELE